MSDFLRNIDIPGVWYSEDTGEIFLVEKYDGITWKTHDQDEFVIWHKDHHSFPFTLPMSDFYSKQNDTSWIYLGEFDE